MCLCVVFSCPFYVEPFQGTLNTTMLTQGVALGWYTHASTRILPLQGAKKHCLGCALSKVQKSPKHNKSQRKKEKRGGYRNGRKGGGVCWTANDRRRGEDMDVKGYCRGVVVGMLVVLLTGCGHPGTGGVRRDDGGSFLLSWEGELVPRDDFVGSLPGASYVLVGEGHTNPCDHRAEARILSAMAAAGLRPVVGLEMISMDMQPVLDRWNDGRISLNGIEEALHWKDRWGYPFALYAPVFELSRKYGLPLAALNVPRRVVDVVRAEGLEGVALHDRSFIPDPLIPASEEQKKALEETVAMHARMMPSSPGKMDRFFLLQSLWDTAMAREAAAWRHATGRPVLVLTGAGHVENRWGIASRLAVLDPLARVVSILPAREKEEITPEGADYYFLCPAHHRKRLGLILSTEEEGLRVRAVEPASRAARAGLLPGDILLEANGEKLASPMDLHRAAVPAVREGKPLGMLILRNGEKREIVIATETEGEKRGEE